MEPPRKRSITAFHSTSYFKNPYDSDSDGEFSPATSNAFPPPPSFINSEPYYHTSTNASPLDSSFKDFRPFKETAVPDSIHHSFISPISDSDGFGAGRRDSMISIASSYTSDAGKDDEKSKSGSDEKNQEHNDDENEGKKKAKKRSRATTEQLAILEDTFAANTSPNSKMREYLAERVGMSERSIQIWFQNRRAKMKQVAKRAHAVQEEGLKKPNFAGMYPYRLPLAPNHLPGNGRLPLPPRHTPQVPPAPNPAVYAAAAVQAHAAAVAHQQRLGQAQALAQAQIQSVSSVTAPTRIASLSGSNCYPSPQPNTSSSPSFSVYPMQTPANNGLRQLTNVKSNATAPTLNITTTPVVAPDAAANTPLSCDTLSVGSWRRLCLTPGDLQCLYNPVEQVFQWQVADNGVRFMMEFPFAAVSSLEYQYLDQNFGHLIVDLNQAPTFFMMQVYSQPGMDGSESYLQKWTQCRDFTEGQQASRFFRHTLKGAAQTLLEQIHAMRESNEGLDNVWKSNNSKPGRLTRSMPNMKFGAHFGNRRSSVPVPDQGMLSDLGPKPLSPLDAAIAELSAGFDAQRSDQMRFSNSSNSIPSSPFMVNINQLPTSPANQSGSVDPEDVKYLQSTEMPTFVRGSQQRAIAQAHSALEKAKIRRSASVPDIELSRNDVDEDFFALFGQDISSGPLASAPHDLQTPVYSYSQEDVGTPSNHNYYYNGTSQSPLPQPLSTISERDDYSSMLSLQQSLTPDMLEAISSAAAELERNGLFSNSDMSSNYDGFLGQNNTNTDNMFSGLTSPNPLASVNTSNANFGMDCLDPTSVAAAAAFVDADFFAELMGTEGLAGLETGVLDC